MERSSSPGSAPLIIPPGFLALARSKMVRLERDGDEEGARAAGKLLSEAEIFAYWEGVDRVKYDSIMGRLKSFIGVEEV